MCPPIWGCAGEPDVFIFGLNIVLRSLRAHWSPALCELFTSLSFVTTWMKVNLKATSHFLSELLRMTENLQGHSSDRFMLLGSNIEYYSECSLSLNYSPLVTPTW